MWGKWIGCTVPVASRERFGSGQRAWAAIGDAEGLVGQVGGWDRETGRAKLLGLWSGSESYGRFMRERHDEVFALSGQKGSFTAIDTAVGGTVLDMAGEVADLPGALAGLKGSELLRVADCRVLPGRAEHFLDVQRRVWGPGMAAASGMRAGVVTRLAPDRYLVTTLWSGRAAHDRYRTEHFPALLDRAGLPDDLRSTTGHLIPLEREWCVVAGARLRPTAEASAIAAPAGADVC
ncbi:DUF4937 domain-containing protein [Streptomyces sp. NPDC001568]|uniref:DUF4937 domain-containing protein n=1 Tax=Streptomyces sp. NPDC001568 TaxID=3364588 RepID=UPI00367FC5CC